MSKSKRTALLLLALAAVIVALLAMSLPRLTLAPGEPFKLADQSGAQGESGVAESALIGWLFRGAVALVVALFPVYIVYSLMSKEGRRRLLLNILLLALFLFVADRLPKQELKQDSESQEITAVNPNELGSGDGLPVSVFDETPPPWVTLAVILLGAGLLVALLAAAYWVYQQRSRPLVDAHLEALAEAAQQTVTAIHAGGDLKTSVIACYREMSRVVQEQRGIARDVAMTPREFEDVLIRQGLPGESVRTLTRLFESVRYGSIATGGREEAQAVACLTEIAAACRGLSSLNTGSGAYAER